MGCAVACCRQQRAMAPPAPLAPTPSRSTPPALEGPMDMARGRCVACVACVAPGPSQAHGARAIGSLAALARPGMFLQGDVTTVLTCVCATGPTLAQSPPWISPFDLQALHRSTAQPPSPSGPAPAAAKRSSRKSAAWSMIGRPCCQNPYAIPETPSFRPSAVGLLRVVGEAR